MAREISHEVPKPAVRKLVTDVVEPDISVEILTVQQEVNSVIDVGRTLCSQGMLKRKTVGSASLQEITPM